MSKELCSRMGGLETLSPNRRSVLKVILVRMSKCRTLEKGRKRGTGSQSFQKHLASQLQCGFWVQGGRRCKVKERDPLRRFGAQMGKTIEIRN